jgi:hypothetical protein
MHDDRLSTNTATNVAFYTSLCRGDFREASRWGDEFVELAKCSTSYGEEVARLVAMMLRFITLKLDEIAGLK